MVIPIKGAIGYDFTSGVMKAYLEKAAKLRPAVVVLDIDTGGGDISDAEEIVDALIATKNVRVVALVHRAISAGATVSLACGEIYMTETATIGDVGEKMQSIWRAVCRKAAEHGGHSSLLAEAMVDPGFAVTMRKVGQKVVIERDGKGDVLKAKGRVLTLTAREAVACGLARGIVDDTAALGQRLGLAGWQEVGRRSTAAVEGKPASLETAPFALYDAASRKVIELRVSESMTDLQKKDLQKNWVAWLDRDHIVGHRVQWTLSLADASDDGTPRVIGTLQARQNEAKQALTKIQDAIRRNPSARSQYDADIKDIQTYIAKVAADIRRCEAAPIWVAANCADEPRFLVGARFAKTFQDALTKIPPRGQITLCGSILDVWAKVGKDKNVLVLVLLEKCSLGSEGDDLSKGGATATAAGAPPAPHGADDQAADGKLNLARAFRRNGFPDKAEPLLKQILSDYPKTAAAEKARKELAEVQAEIKKGS
jgi:tetratricopeptide (TPR) repeat protein